jgi:GNAT superfamily N-acetyltransferase
MTRRLVRLGDEHKDAMLALLRGAHGESVGDWQKDIWNWKIKDNPARLADQQYQIGMVENDELLGAMTMMPLRVKIGDEIRDAAILLDVVVSPRVQRQGIATTAPRILQEAVRISPTFTYGVAEERMRRVWERIWGHDGLIRVCNRYHRILALAPVLRAKLALSPPLAVVLGAGYQAFAAVADRLAAWRGPHDIEVKQVAAVDQAFDALWTWAGPSHTNLMVRDQRFVRWRFELLPNRRYTILGAYRKDVLVGYAVLRLLEEGGLRKALIVDLFTHRRETGIARKLLVAATTEARRRGAATVSLLEVPERGMQQNLRLSLYFAEKRAAFMCGHSNTLALPDYCDGGKWWITLADADLEIAY